MKKYYIILIAFLGCLGLQAKDMTGLKIYINPGHGGYDSDDRNVAVYPYAQGDTLGFWESSSNLHKGLMLRELLQEQGATVAMSRVLNRTEDDRGLETIGREASEWEADLFFSIHSNATIINNTGDISRCESFCVEVFHDSFGEMPCFHPFVVHVEQTICFGHIVVIRTF